MKQTTNQPAAQPRYELTPETAAVIDCMRQASNLYDAIIAAVVPCHTINGNTIINGEDITDEIVAPYLQHINAITELLQKEVTGRIEDAVGHCVCMLQNEVKI